MSEKKNGPRCFNKQAAIDQAKHEDSDGYFGFMSGAEWQHQQNEAVIAELERKLQIALKCLESAYWVVTQSLYSGSMQVSDFETLQKNQETIFYEIQEALAAIKQKGEG